MHRIVPEDRVAAGLLDLTPLCSSELTLVSSALPAGVPEASNEFLCRMWGS